jgi:hypothetical protein
MAEWHRTELGRLRELVWRVEQENLHGLLYEVTDPCSGRLPTSSLEFKILRAIIAPFPVPMMHLFIG